MDKLQKNASCEVSFFSSFGFLLVSLGSLFIVLKLLEPHPDMTFSSFPGVVAPLSHTAAKDSSSLAKTGNGGHSSFALTSSGGGRGALGHSEAADGASPAAAPGLDGDAQQMLTTAIGLIDKGDPHKAMAILEKLIAADPKNEQALIEMGMIHLIDLQDTQAALPYLEKAFHLNSDNKVVLAELVSIYDELEQPEAGLNFLQTIYDEKPDNATVAMGIGQIMKEQNRFSDAIPYWEKAAENAPADQAEVAYTELGDLYQRTGQLDKSLSSFQVAATKVQQKYDDGYFSHDDAMGKEELVAAHLNVVKVLISQNRPREAQEIVDDKLKNLYHGNLGDLAKQIEKSNMLFGYKQ